MEIVWDVHGVDEFPRINIHKHSLEQGRRLHHRPLVSTLESFGICKVGQHSSQFGGFLNILMNIHALQSLIEIKRYELGLCVTKVLIVVHPVVCLILEPVQIANSPSDLEPITLFLTIILLFVHLLRNVHSFNIELQWCKFITFIEHINDVVHLFINIILFGFFQQLRYRAVHNLLLTRSFEHVLLIFLAKDRVNVLRVHRVLIIQPFHVIFCVEQFTRDESLLVISCPVILAHVFLYPHFCWDFALDGPSFSKERLNLGAILLYVEIIYILDPIHIVRWWLMQITIVTKMPSIWKCLGKPLVDRLGQHSKILSSIFFINI